MLQYEMAEQERPDQPKYRVNSSFDRSFNIQDIASELTEINDPKVADRLRHLDGCRKETLLVYYLIYKLLGSLGPVKAGRKEPDSFLVLPNNIEKLEEENGAPDAVLVNVYTPSEIRYRLGKVPRKTFIPLSRIPDRSDNLKALHGMIERIANSYESPSVITPLYAGRSNHFLDITAPNGQSVLSTHISGVTDEVLGLRLEVKTDNIAQHPYPNGVFKLLTDNNQFK